LDILTFVKLQLLFIWQVVAFLHLDPDILEELELLTLNKLKEVSNMMLLLHLQSFESKASIRLGVSMLVH
jgi:hypothetical protein